MATKIQVIEATGYGTYNRKSYVLIQMLGYQDWLCSPIENRADNRFERLDVKQISEYLLTH